MNKLLQILLIIVGGSTVAVADVLIKKISTGETNFRSGIQHPLMPMVLILYLSQILIFLYLFYKKAGLGLVGIATFTIYTVIVVAGAFLLFEEKVTLVQGIGMVFAVLGVLLMNI